MRPTRLFESGWTLANRKILLIGQCEFLFHQGCFRLFGSVFKTPFTRQNNRIAFTTAMIPKNNTNQRKLLDDSSSQAQKLISMATPPNPRMAIRKTDRANAPFFMNTLLFTVFHLLYQQQREFLYLNITIRSINDPKTIKKISTIYCM